MFFFRPYQNKKRPGSLFLRGSGFSFIEMLVVLLLFSIILYVSYMVFFSQAKAVQQSVDSIKVNDQFRKIQFYIGKDIREANMVDVPKPVPLDKAPKLTTTIGTILRILKQEIDPTIKPVAPSGNVLRKRLIEYQLEPRNPQAGESAEEGPRYRLVRIERLQEKPGETVEQRTEITDAVRDLVIFRTIRKPMVASNIGDKGDKLLEALPSSLAGTGYNLLHLKVVLERERTNRVQSEVYGIALTTSFAIRGKGVFPNP